MLTRGLKAGVELLALPETPAEGCSSGEIQQHKRTKHNIQKSNAQKVARAEESLLKACFVKR